jgi:hypothetical protein
VTKIVSLFILLLLIVAFCKNRQTLHNGHLTADPPNIASYGTIGQIPVPAGYERVIAETNSFSEWLRQIRLKRDSKVYLYNGTLKANQLSQFAVLDISVGNSDLQQCADAIMRLRAEYFFNQNNINAIHFKATAGNELSFAKWLKGERYKLKGNKLFAYITKPSPDDKRVQLDKFLEIVFTYCGTLSLEKETRSINLNDIQIGDVFVKGRGHAMMVVDVAVNHEGKKMYMLAQSAMPAQDIHIVKNPMDEKVSPWYEIGTGSKIITPEWIFFKNQVKRW